MHPSLQNRTTLGYMRGTCRQGGQRRQWPGDVTDWTDLKLPEVVTLAAERRRYRQFVHRVVQAPHGIWYPRLSANQRSDGWLDVTIHVNTLLPTLGALRRGSVSETTSSQQQTFAPSRSSDVNFRPMNRPGTKIYDPRRTRSQAVYERSKQQMPWRFFLTSFTNLYQAIGLQQTNIRSQTTLSCTGKLTSVCLLDHRQSKETAQRCPCRLHFMPLDAVCVNIARLSWNLVHVTASRRWQTVNQSIISKNRVMPDQYTTAAFADAARLIIRAAVGIVFQSTYPSHTHKNPWESPENPHTHRTPKSSISISHTRCLFVRCFLNKHINLLFYNI